MAYTKIQEEELKNKIAKIYFGKFDCTKIIGKIDFCVTLTNKHQNEESLYTESFLWAEAKQGIKADIYESFVQLILTIGRARTFDTYLPPKFLGAFDAEKIAFIPYEVVHEIFYQNDFNWNVTPSNHETKEFKQLYDKVSSTIENNSMLFFFDRDDKELGTFIKDNFVLGKINTSKIRIDKNNFTVIYTKWLDAVKSTIAVNWDIAKKSGIIDGDFYLADLLSQDNVSLKEKLYVLLKVDHYEMGREFDAMGLFTIKSTSFMDGQKAHNLFWSKYERPPKEEYWDYIVERRDLLVPQDVRERKGSFFTPKIWVELSQKYIADVLGEDWQDEYYVWDCAAGTGNLLAGLTNKYNIWASTVDKQDVDVMKDRIKNGANLLEDHVFQFDFLNDDFDKLPKGLQDIINTPEKRKKLVVYINPPYAEAGTGQGKRSKIGVALNHKTKDKYKTELGKASNELFTQFFIRIYCEILGCWIAEFSTLKILQSTNFSDFRQIFQPKLEKCFVVPANTFDNVKGDFPIGFFVWDSEKKENFIFIESDVFDKNGDFIGTKNIYSYDDFKKGKINDWLRLYYDKKNDSIGIMHNNKTDFQHNNQVTITSFDNKDHTTLITKNNLIEMCIYISMRHLFEATWLNDRDQFLYPNDGWKSDTEFQNDCLAFALFHGQNKISSKGGINHWIPFTESEVNSRDKFASNFMTDYISGRLKKDKPEGLFEDNAEPARKTALEFSKEASDVFDAGRELWRYYHAQPNCNVNASLYDIREHFQGRNDKGKMNNKSEDETYMHLITALRNSLKILAKKIEPKVYEYGFLKR